MRAVVQRVKEASVRVGERLIGEIPEGGLLVFLGAEEGDGESDVDFLLNKILGLRIFSDDEGKMNLSLLDTGKACLVVSQFTLLGDCRRGRRPSFGKAMPPVAAEALIESFIKKARASVHVETGQFRADMDVALVNDGPVTLLLDSKKLF